MKYSYTLLLLLGALQLCAQATAVVTGTVKDASSGQPIIFTTVYAEGINTAVETNEKGFYLLRVPAEQELTIRFTRVGYKATSIAIQALQAEEKRQLNASLASNEVLEGVEIRESRVSDPGMITEDVEAFKLLPTASGNFEAILPQIALGTSSGTGGELSSQYNVRGGNYDENLVYVNDFQVYRPQLIRTGQQEGLTFPNLDLTQSLSFSSGGFQARYGDKLSSVLDVKYKRPDSTRASLTASLLGGGAHVEGSRRIGKSNYKRFRYLLGARYKTTAYLLGSLETEGEYIPNFYDVQTYLTYDLSRDWQIGLLANFNRAEYQFEPASRNTVTGLLNFALQLNTAFEGQEISDFTTAMGGLSLTYVPEKSKHPMYLKFLTSAFRIDENERVDITGFYLLGQVDSDLGSDDFGDLVSVLGTGTEQDYIRNFLTSYVYNAEHRGGIEYRLNANNLNRRASHFVQWGAKYQREQIEDRINEWERIDSAGYSIRVNAPDQSNVVELNQVFKSRNSLESNRYSAFVQNTYSFRRDGKSEWQVTAGLRAQYWDLNEELIVSPRMQLSYRPLRGKADLSYRFAAGMYQQSPFYREMRNPQGIVNTDLKAQKSIHLVGGLTWEFLNNKYAARRYKLIAELYYKRLWDVVSYEIDNVRIRYSGQNDAEAYVMGLDLRLNGELVPGAESWINFSFIRARERLLGVQHFKASAGEPLQETAYVPRPTDQFLVVSMFLQDYLPQNKDFKMNVMLTWGSGLPFGFPENNQIVRNSFRFRSYLRCDAGLSVKLYDRANRYKQPKHFLGFTRNTWLSLEALNLLGVANVASNTWIKLITNQQLAIPNFLTSRRVNLRLRMEF